MFVIWDQRMFANWNFLLIVWKRVNFLIFRTLFYCTVHAMLYMSVTLLLLAWYPDDANFFFCLFILRIDDNKLKSFFFFYIWNRSEKKKVDLTIEIKCVYWLFFGGSLLKFGKFEQLELCRYPSIFAYL